MSQRGDKNATVGARARRVPRRPTSGATEAAPLFIATRWGARSSSPQRAAEGARARAAATHGVRARSGAAHSAAGAQARDGGK